MAARAAMTWAHPERWLWLWLVPLLIVFWVWAFRRRRAALAQFAHPMLWPHLAGSVDWGARRVKAAAVTIGLLCLLLALVGPRWGFRWQEVTQRGVDIVIALDVSKSMLATDVRPNRLERAKLAIQELLTLLDGDRAGLVAFAGTAFVQCPLTADYGAYALTLDSLNVDSIPRGGTSLSQAITESLAAIKDSPRQSRAIVLITDGESHEGDIHRAVGEAAEQGVKIYTIGIGTPEGELILIGDASGQQAFLKDQQGRTVKSRLNEEALQQIALATGGSYVRATATSFGLDLIYRERISQLQERELESTMKKQHEQRFQYVLVIALLLLGVEPCFSDRRRAASA